MKKSKVRPVDWASIIIALIIAIFLMKRNGLSEGETTWLTIGIFVALEIVFAVYKSLAKKRKASGQASIGITHVSSDQKGEIVSRQKSSYENAMQSFSEPPEKKYSVDYATINSLLNLSKRLALNDIATGQRMQQETGPQQDWAITGGLVSGVAGGFAGAAAAMDVMRQNAEATEKHHAMGRRIEQNGIETYASLSESQRKINTQKLNDLTFTCPDASLASEIDVQCNSVTNYSTGYLDTEITFTVKPNIVFPDSSNRPARIDGSVKVDLLDSNGNVVAYGYYSAPGRSGNDLSGTGFVPPSFSSKTVMKLTAPNFNKLNGYSAQISNANLWLLKVQ